MMKRAQPRAPKAFGVYVATPLGFEPRITPPKGAVLPLHHGVFGFAILDWRFSIQAQCPKFKPDLGYAEQLAPTIEVESTANGASVILAQQKKGTRLWSAQFSFSITAFASNRTALRVNSAGTVQRLLTKRWMKGLVNQLISS